MTDGSAFVDNFNLEAEYGGLLDILEERISEVGPSVQHYGIKGMKWGVRRDQPAAEPLKSLGPDSVTRKTKSGETITLQKVPATKFHEFMGRRSKNYRDEYSKQAMLNILDSSGKKVGDAVVQKRSKDELYLEWLGIHKSERGKGYASAVMKAGRDFGKQEGFKKMVLEVPGNSPDARHIYENLGFKYVGEADGGHKDPIWGGLSKMEYNFDEVKHNELAHYGIKGMRWGVRKANPKDTPNKKYSQTNREIDRGSFGKRGEKRINRSMNKGKTHGQAVRREFVRSISPRIALAGAIAAGSVLKLHGTSIARQAETNRGRASAAATMGLPRTASTGPDYAKQKRGAYNISSL